MKPINDNVLNPEYIELKQLNDIHHVFEEKTMNLFKSYHPRALSNFLWFAKFELSFKAAEVKLKRESITLVKSENNLSHDQNSY